MAKKKLLYVCPHLSTGGQPQYTYKQIKHFIDDFQIEVVEINNSGGDAYVVQKNRIKSLVSVHTLSDNKNTIFDIIRTFQPDIIHFQEIPEFDLPIDVVEKIFSKDRKYFIVCSTHGSYTNPSVDKDLKNWVLRLIYGNIQLKIIHLIKRLLKKN